MTNLQPSDWDVRIIIWQCQVRGDNIMATQRHFENHAGDEGYPNYAPDRDTISKIRGELFTLLETNPELLRALPSEVQAYVIKKRPGFKDKARFVDLDDEEVYSYKDFVAKVAEQPYRNRDGALVVTTDMLGRLRRSSS